MTPNLAARYWWMCTGNSPVSQASLDPMALVVCAMGDLGTDDRISRVYATDIYLTRSNA